MDALNCLLFNLIQCLDDLRKSFHASPGQGQGHQSPSSKQHLVTKNIANNNPFVTKVSLFCAGFHRHARRVQDFGGESFSEAVAASQYGLCC